MVREIPKIAKIPGLRLLGSRQIACAWRIDTELDYIQGYARKGNRLFRNLRHGSYLVMVVKGAIGSTELRRQQQLSLDLCEQPAGFGKKIKLRWVFDRGRGSEIASGRIVDPPIALANSYPSQVFDLAVRHECGAG